MDVINSVPGVIHVVSNLDSASDLLSFNSLVSFDNNVVLKRRVLCCSSFATGATPSN